MCAGESWVTPGWAFRVEWPRNGQAGDGGGAGRVVFWGAEHLPFLSLHSHHSHPYENQAVLLEIQVLLWRVSNTVLAMAPAPRYVGSGSKGSARSRPPVERIRAQIPSLSRYRDASLHLGHNRNLLPHVSLPSSCTTIFNSSPKQRQSWRTASWTRLGKIDCQGEFTSFVNKK